MAAVVDQQFAIWPGTRETARSEIAPYPEITAKRGVYEVGRALRARRSEAGSAILRIAGSAPAVQKDASSEPRDPSAPHQQFAIWPGTRETARSEIAPL